MGKNTLLQRKIQLEKNNNLPSPPQLSDPHIAEEIPSNGKWPQCKDTWAEDLWPASPTEPEFRCPVGHTQYRNHVWNSSTLCRWQYMDFSLYCCTFQLMWTDWNWLKMEPGRHIKLKCTVTSVQGETLFCFCLNSISQMVSVFVLFFHSVDIHIKFASPLNFFFNLTCFFWLCFIDCLLLRYFKWLIISKMYFRS